MTPTKKIVTYEDAYPVRHTKLKFHHLHRRTFPFSTKLFNKQFVAENLRQIKEQLEKRVLSERQNVRKIENNFIETPVKNSARDFAGLLWTWRVQNAAKKAKKKNNFLQHCVWLTLEAMTDIEVHILAQLLINYRIIFPKLGKLITNYKQVIKYLQKFSKRRMTVHLIIKALNHWFTIMPLLEEIRQYTGWLYLLNIKAYFLDADALYDVLVKVENTQ